MTPARETAIYLPSRRPVIDKQNRIIVADESIIVAMDIAIVIADALGCGAEPVSCDQLASMLDRLAAPPDLVILDRADGSGDFERAASRLLGAGARLIIGSADHSHRDGVAGFEGHPVFLKPYDTEALVSLVARMLAGKPHAGR